MISLQITNFFYFRCWGFNICRPFFSSLALSLDVDWSDIQLGQFTLLWSFLPPCCDWGSLGLGITWRGGGEGHNIVTFNTWMSSQPMSGHSCSKGWIVISTGWIIIQQIQRNEISFDSSSLMCEIVVNPVDNAIHLLKTWSQNCQYL